MKTKYTVPEVPGSSRVSARPYTHAVVGRVNVKRQRQEASDTKGYEHKNYAYFNKVLKAGLGGQWGSFNDGKPLLVSQDQIDCATRELEGCETLADYVAKQQRLGLARINATYGDADAGGLHVLQWSMSEKNAAAKVNGWREWHVDVRVVECQPVEKKQKTA